MGGSIKILLLSAMSVFLLNCQRAKDTSSVVTIDLPNLEVAKASQSATADFNLLTTTIDSGNLGVIIDSFVPRSADGDAWSSKVPSGFSQAQPINCYAVVAGLAPGATDDKLKKNHCGKISNGQLSKDLRFGPWVGAIYASPGSKPPQAQLEVENGNDRVFSIIGFHADDPAQCVDFKSFRIKKTNLSRPYFLGSSDPVNLSGDSSIVKVRIQFDEDRFYDDCELNNSLEVADTDFVPQKIRLTKNEFPANMAFQAHCYPVDIQFLNQAGQKVPIAAPGLSSIKLKIGERPATGQSTSPLDATTYDSYSDCENYDDGDDGETNFFPQTEEISIRRWIRPPVSTGTVQDITAYVNSGGLVEPSDITVSFQETSFRAYSVLGPKNVRKDTCAPYIVTVRNAANQETPSTANMNIKTLMDAPSGSNSHGIFTNSSCTGSAVGAQGNFPMVSVDSNSTTFRRAVVYVKFSGTIDVEQNLVIQQASSQEPLTRKARKAIVATNGGLVNHSFMIGGFVTRVEAGKCMGPFYVGVTNRYDDVVSRQLPASLSAIKPTLESSKFDFHSDSNCSIGITEAKFNAGASFSDEFYIKIKLGDDDDDGGEIKILNFDVGKDRILGDTFKLRGDD